jgi:hypothetical protein
MSKERITVAEQSRSMRNFLALLAVLLTLAACLRANAADMKAGVAKVDITPPLGVQMWGYFDRLTGDEGVLDPLYARVLVLEAGGKRIAYVDMDLGRTFGPASLDRMRESAKNNSGINYVLLQATHTHAGPVIMDQYASGTPEWETSALGKIDQAIHEAQQHIVPVRMGIGYGEATIGYNRRLPNLDGTVTMLWRNPGKTPTSPVDPVISVLRIDRMDGQPLAILVNYSTHPVTFGPDMLKFSADFPGVMCKVVEQAFDGKPLVFFAQGAPGDINVYDATTLVANDAVGRRDWAGETLGKAVVEAAKEIQTQTDPNPSLDFAETSLPFHLRWDPDKFRQEVLRQVSPKAFELFAPPIQKMMLLPVATVLIDRKFAIMGMPGEPFLQFQTSWREQCPVQACLFFGYANGYYGYFPTIRASTEGGYGATSATTWVEVGAGEQMEERALIDLYKMLGRLQDIPRSDWINSR